MKKASPDEVGDIASDQGFLVKVKDGYQVYGSALMEAAIAQFLV
ncbi:hypothetical protein BMETH_33731142441941, partial [methanotrophic bacterial endosymbiont of Bathymodiolus sp.]